MASMASSIGRHSLIHWQTREGGPGDTPEVVLESVCKRLRELNVRSGSRELSLAITKIEEAQHWLRALSDRRSV